MPEGGLELGFVLADGVHGVCIVLELGLEHVKGLLTSRVGDLDDRLEAADQVRDVVRFERLFELIEDQRISTRVTLSGGTNDSTGGGADIGRDISVLCHLIRRVEGTLVAKLGEGVQSSNLNTAFP